MSRMQIIKYIFLFLNPHDGMKKKFSDGERLNKCNLTCDEHLALKHESMSWLTENSK